MQAAPDERTLFGHPPALFVLFFTELWERFSFYGMRALLVLFMTKEFLFGDEQAYGVYAAYGSLVYTAPIVGGLLAERYLGYRHSIILGAVLMTLGHLTLGLEPLVAGSDSAMLASLDESKALFYGALALLIIGNGFFKPTISSLVGKLYPEGDTRRDGAFTIFYMGINVGAFLAPLVCGYLGETWGWHWGFGAAGVGMAAGLVNFLAYQSRFGEHGMPPSRHGRPPTMRPDLQILTCWVGAFLAVVPVTLLVRFPEMLGDGLVVVGVIVLAALLGIAFTSPPVERDRMFVVTVLILFSVMFWAFFEQAGSSINLFTERNVNRSIGGFEAPTTWGQSINAFFIVALAIPFSRMWTRLAELGRDPSPGVKFAIALIQLGAGFLILAASGWFADAAGRVPLIFLILGYLLHTTGELCLSPVGLAMISRLSPARMVGFVMGAWFLSSAFAHYIAGLIASLTGVGGEDDAADALAEAVPGLEEGAVTEAIAEAVHAPDALASLEAYTSVFGTIGLVAIGTGVLLFAISPLLRHWTHDAT